MTSLGADLFVNLGEPYGLAPVEVKHAHADAETVTEFLSRTGYQLPVALADLIDNAIDAGATRVHVGLIFQKDRPAVLVVADNGHGMDGEELERAVSLEKDPAKQAGHSLGRYGAGLKAASFSLGRVLTIATRRGGGRALGAKLDQSLYTRNYEYGVLSAEAASMLLGLAWGGTTLGASGTVLLISDLASMVPRSNSSQDLFLEDFGRELDVRLGLVFHRFIESGHLRISKGMRAIDDLDSEFGLYNLAPVNPFGYPSTGQVGYPRELSVVTGDFSVPVVLHLWPKQGRTKSSRHHNYDILGRSGEWQGFYYYRWDRMLQAGGWNGVLSQEPHTSYARIAVDLPSGSDNEFRPTVMKDRIENARPLLEVLTSLPDWADYIGSARRVYRGQGSAHKAPAANDRSQRTKLNRPAFVKVTRGPSIKLRGNGRLELDDRLIKLLGKARADAVAELVWQSARPYIGRRRLTDVLKRDWQRLEESVRVLGARRR